MLCHRNEVTENLSRNRLFYGKDVPAFIVRLSPEKNSFKGVEFFLVPATMSIGGLEIFVLWRILTKGCAEYILNACGPLLPLFHWIASDTILRGRLQTKSLALRIEFCKASFDLL